MFWIKSILVSTVPLDSSPSSSSSNTYKHTASNARPTPKTTVAAIAGGSETLGQIYQLEMGDTDTFGVKVNPFTLQDASIPLTV